MNKSQTINCRGKLLNLSQPIVMGIVNLTPDSFYDGGKFKSQSDIVSTVKKMLEDGATIIDAGAASTRPGANILEPEIEKERLLPVARLLVKEFPDALFSVDTYNSEIASMIIDSGFHIVNDISAGSLDSKMFETVATLKVPYVLMHIKGTPQTMQTAPHYENVVNEVVQFFSEKINVLRSKLVNDIIIDVGFGFGKTVEHNYALLRNLEMFQMFNCPVLAGVSRKAMISKVLNIKAGEALNGTTVINTIALMNGAKILRVHDVKEAVEAVKLFNAFQGVF